MLLIIFIYIFYQKNYRSRSLSKLRSVGFFYSRGIAIFFSGVMRFVLKSHKISTINFFHIPSRFVFLTVSVGLATTQPKRWLALFHHLSLWFSINEKGTIQSNGPNVECAPLVETDNNGVFYLAVSSYQLKHDSIKYVTSFFDLLRHSTLLPFCFGLQNERPECFDPAIVIVIIILLSSIHNDSETSKKTHGQQKQKSTNPIPFFPESHAGIDDRRTTMFVPYSHTTKYFAYLCQLHRCANLQTNESTTILSIIFSYFFSIHNETHIDRSMP